MRKMWQQFAPSRCLLFSSLAIMIAGPAEADPIRLSVAFTVAGDAQRDPDFGNDVATGAFSVVTTLGPGDRVTNHDGFGADLVAFSWAGVTYTPRNADVLQIGFTSRGGVELWNLSGMVPGDAGGLTAGVFPDFSLTFCQFCGPAFEQSFNYTTARSPDGGIFQGRLSSFTLNTSPAAPIPEPASLLLVGGALIGAVRARRKPSAR